MKFEILSRSKAIKKTYDNSLEDCVIISITDYKSPRVDFAPNSAVKKILRLEFNDVLRNDPHCMTSDQAEQILDFANNWHDKVNLIIVHCEAGVCRSAAVAAALSKIFNEDDMWVFDNPRFYPNSWVYRLILEAEFGGFDERNFAKKRQVNNRRWRELEGLEEEE